VEGGDASSLEGRYPKRAPSQLIPAVLRKQNDKIDEDNILEEVKSSVIKILR